MYVHQSQELHKYLQHLLSLITNHSDIIELFFNSYLPFVWKEYHFNILPLGSFSWEYIYILAQYIHLFLDTRDLSSTKSSNPSVKVLKEFTFCVKGFQGLHIQVIWEVFCEDHIGIAFTVPSGSETNKVRSTLLINLIY